MCVSLFPTDSNAEEGAPSETNMAENLIDHQTVLRRQRSIAEICVIQTQNRVETESSQQQGGQRGWGYSTPTVPPTTLTRMSSELLLLCINCP